MYKPKKGDRLGRGTRQGEVISVLEGDVKDYNLWKTGPKTVLLVKLDKSRGS